MKYFLNDKVYQILKWIGLTVCPALAVFVAAVGSAWGWSSIEAIVLTINAIGVLIGALIGVSQGTAKKVSNDEYFETPIESPADLEIDQTEGFTPLTREEAIAVFDLQEENAEE